MSASAYRRTPAHAVVCVVLRHDASRWRLVARHLAPALGAPPACIEIVRDRRGRPRIARPATDVRLSIAHTGGVLAVAWATVDIGVDVEPADRAVGGWALWSHVLTPSESRAVPQREPWRTRALLRAWVSKEALLKAAGVGLAVEPGAIELGEEGDVRAVPASLGAAEDWSLQRFELPGLVAAVACRSAGISLVLHDDRAVSPTSRLAPAPG